jgi:hypothetical protein
MRQDSIRLSLNPSFFAEKERELLRTSSYSASLFRYRSGVEALRVAAGRGALVWLPYLGQQIWDWSVDGKSLKFEGFVEEPAYRRNFLQNYGAFIIHCGMTAMGNPGPKDTHLHHGELPVARFDEAWIELCREGEREELSLCGRIHWHVPFVAEYVFAPSLRLSSDGLSMSVEARLENPSPAPLDYMYLAHINFPFTGAERLSSTTPFDAEHICVRDEGIPGMGARPEGVKRIEQSASYEPELVAILDDRGSAEGVSGSILHYTDGTSRWARQETAGLDHHVIWMTHAPGRGACGFHLPSTAGLRGLEAEKALGNVKRLAPGESVTLRYACGYCDRAADAPVEGAV